MKNILEKFKIVVFVFMVVIIICFVVLGVAYFPRKNSNNNLSGYYGLDPKNDPVFYTTESGIDIKYGGLDISGTLDTGSLKGYPYITLGGYNWIIIGQATNLSLECELLSVIQKQPFVFQTWKQNALLNFQQYFMSEIYEEYSPAGLDIASSIINSYIVDDGQGYESFTITQNTEISSGCVLCLSENIIGKCAFGSTTYYPGSTLDTEMTKIYTGVLASNSAIQNTSLKTAGYSGGTNKLYTHSDYLFPLAYYYGGNSFYSGQNFYVDTYLNSNDKRNIDGSVMWWLRTGDSSGSTGSRVGPTGKANTGATLAYSGNGIRPAFVLKI